MAQFPILCFLQKTVNISLHTVKVHMHTSNIPSRCSRVQCYAFCLVVFSQCHKMWHKKNFFFNSVVIFQKYFGIFRHNVLLDSLIRIDTDYEGTVVEPG